MERLGQLRLGLALGGVLLVSAAYAADTSAFRASVGYDYTTGKYGGTQTIDETYVPFTAAYEMNDVELRVTVPYASVSGPATIIDGTTGEFAPGPGGTRSGLGDVVMGLSLYDLLRSSDAGFQLDAGAKVKFGTADESKGLGTGETDYSLQMNGLQEFGPAALFATAGYIWRGSPTGLHLRSVAFGSIGGDVRVADAARAGVTYGYRPAAISGFPAVQEASMFLAFAPTGGLTLRPYVSVGFSDSSPSWGAGVSLGWKLRVHEGEER